MWFEWTRTFDRLLIFTATSRPLGFSFPRCTVPLFKAERHFGRAGGPKEPRPMASPISRTSSTFSPVTSKGRSHVAANKVQKRSRANLTLAPVA